MKLYTWVNKWYSVRQTTCALRNARIKRPINVIIIIIIIKSTEHSHVYQKYERDYETNLEYIGGGTSIIDGGGDVPLDRVWFSRSSILTQGI